MKMADLLAEVPHQPLNFYRGDEVTGEIVVLTSSEVVVDLGGKSEGLINRHDFLDEDRNSLKVGDQLKAYVLENDRRSGQIILTPYKISFNIRQSNYPKTKQFNRTWQKMIQAQRGRSQIKGLVVETNKGGLIVEVESLRGFLPLSQLSLENLKEAKFSQGEWEALVGKELTLTVIEADPMANRLIFSGRINTPDLKQKLASFPTGQTRQAEIKAITPVALYLDLGDGVEGIVIAQEVSWEKTENLNELYQVGAKIDVKVVGISEETSKVNLSVKGLMEDPFEKLTEDFQTDDVVSGIITNISPAGILVQLDLKESTVILEGFVAANKLGADNNYAVGEKNNFLVDSVDQNKRRINLAPFITSTVGLIYK